MLGNECKTGAERAQEKEGNETETDATPPAIAGNHPCDKCADSPDDENRKKDIITHAAERISSQELRGNYSGLGRLAVTFGVALIGTARRSATL